MSKISLLVYGSLINKNELLNNDIQILDYKPVLLNGYRREFSQEPSWRKATNINRAVLNTRKDSNYCINALLIDIYKKDIETIDKREIGYDRLKVDFNSIDSKYDLISDVKNKDIFIYCGKEEKYNKQILPNMKYLDICLKGAFSWKKEFYNDFIETTFIQEKSLKESIKYHL